MTSPSMATARWTFWYSWMSSTMRISGMVTDWDSIWKAISSPMDRESSNTPRAPTQITATVMSRSRVLMMAWPAAAMRRTSKLRVTAAAEPSSQRRRRPPSRARLLTVFMPWMVSTSKAWRSPSAAYRAMSRR